jgi:hypothetical protein
MQPAAVQHDAAGMEREAAGLMGKPGFDDAMLYTESDTAAYAGQFSKARELTRRASESAQRADEKETAATYEAEAAMREALVGNMSQAKQQAQAVLALSTGRDVEAISAIALALAGDVAQAIRLAADAKRFPEDTIVQFNYLPTIRAAAALEGGSATKAIEALAPVAPYELGGTAPTLSFALYPVYLRGEAYVAAHQGSAAAEFQKILDHPGVVVNEPIGALAHLQIGRAYAVPTTTVNRSPVSASLSEPTICFTYWTYLLTAQGDSDFFIFVTNGFTVTLLTLAKGRSPISGRIHLVMDLPVVKQKEQRRPALKAKTVEQLVQYSEGDEQALYLIEGAAGMRISEALALERKHIINNCRTICIRQQVDRDTPRIVQFLKTDAAYREIDITEEVAVYLRTFLEQKEGLLFKTRNGTPYLHNSLKVRWLLPRLTAMGLGRAGWAGTASGVSARLGCAGSRSKRT